MTWVLPWLLKQQWSKTVFYTAIFTEATSLYKLDTHQLNHFRKCSLKWNCWWNIWPGVWQINHNSFIRRSSWPWGCSILEWDGWYRRRLLLLFFTTVMSTQSNWRILKVHMRRCWACLLHWNRNNKHALPALIFTRGENFETLPHRGGLWTGSGRE